MVITHRLEGGLTLRLAAIAATMAAGSRMPLEWLLRLAVLARHEDDHRHFPKFLRHWQEPIVAALVAQQLRIRQECQARSASTPDTSPHNAPPPDT